MLDELDVRLGRATPEEMVAEPEKKVEPAVVAPVADTEAEEDAKALARYNKRMNTTFASWEEVTAASKPAAVETESEEEKKEKRNKAKFSFALNNNLLSTTEYESYIQDSHKEPRTLVYENFRAERKAAGDSDKKIEAAFARMYGEDLADDDEDDVEKINSFVKQQHIADMQREAARILKQKYPAMYTLDDKYSQWESAQQQQWQAEEKLTQIAKTYKTDVEAIAAATTNKKVSFTHNNEPFETDVPYNPETIQAVTKEFLSANVLAGFTAQYSKAAVQEAFLLRLNALSQDNITAHVAKSYHAKQMEKKKIQRNNLVPEEIVTRYTPAGEPDVLDRRLGYVKN